VSPRWNRPSVQFTYRAKQDSHNEASGVIEAVDLSSAIMHLKQSGFYPLEVAALVPSTRADAELDKDRPLSRQYLALWARTVGQGLSAGLSLTQALHLLAEQERGRRLGTAARRLEEQVTAGMTLADGMEGLGSCFSPVAVCLARAGGASGALEEVLQALAEQVESESDLIGKLLGALVYPVFVLIVGVGTVAVLLWVVVPKLAVLFQETGQPLPWATRMMIQSGRIGFWATVSMLAAAPIALWACGRASLRARLAAWGMRMLSGLPLFGRLIERAEIARLSSTLSMLLSHGLPLPEALRLAAGTVVRPQLRNQIRQVYREVVEGIGFSSSMRRAGIREGFLLTVVAMGEAHGDLARSFQQAADRYSSEVDRSVKALSALIEPSLILLVGLLVGAVVFSMLLPIFQINFAVG